MKRILVADDDNNTRLMLSKVLSKSNYKVVLAKDGREAIELLLTERFDFCIIDYYMPYINGIELIQLMKEQDNLKDIPFILLSATDKLETLEEAMQVGAKWYLRKSDLDITTLPSYINTITTLGFV